MAEVPTMQIDRSRKIANTRIFDLRESRRGYRLNRMAISLTVLENREAFKRDGEAYMARYGLTEQERDLVRRRDFGGMTEAGGNIYFMLKIGVCTGNGLYRIGAQMRGETYEEFLATRNVREAV